MIALSVSVCLSFSSLSLSRPSCPSFITYIGTRVASLQCLAGLCLAILILLFYCEYAISLLSNKNIAPEIISCN